jgi:hypothetical protein
MSRISSDKKVNRIEEFNPWLYHVTVYPMHVKIQNVLTMQKSLKALVLVRNVKDHVSLTQSAKAAAATANAQC